MRSTAKATFGAGCFWHVEERFRKLKGVMRTAVGYMGGALFSPSYKDVCTGRTGHAEVVQLEFDPKVIPYKRLLQEFWELHDPTTPNRQGPDIGTQYRSVIFYHDSLQKKEAELSRQELASSRRYNKPIVTEIVKAGEFFVAEEYHQKYLMKRGRDTCFV
jgi:peptide-methionine (S)-S-oxide reductase